MKNLKFVKIKDISEFLNTLGYEWSGIIIDGDLLKIASIEDFENTVCLDLKKDNEHENLNIEVTDFNLYLENKQLKQKFNFDDYSIMWQAFMIYHKNEDYSKLLYEKTLLEKHQIEKTYNEKINLTQKLLDRYKFEKSFKSAQHNTTLLNIENKFEYSPKNNDIENKL